jgi:hypothetical protein
MLKKIMRKGKKIRQIRFADGQIFTILDMDVDPQTSDVTLYLRKNVGVEFLIIPIIIGLGLLLGWATYGTNGALLGAFASGFAGLFLTREFSTGQRIIERTIPKDAIIGLDNYYQLKADKYCLCTHAYDSQGNPVLMENDDFSKMTNRLVEKDKLINHLKGMISTLHFRISESQLSRKELADTVASELKKILESTVTPAKSRPYIPSYTGIPPETFMQPETKEEGEEE